MRYRANALRPSTHSASSGHFINARRALNQNWHTNSNLINPPIKFIQFFFTSSARFIKSAPSIFHNARDQPHATHKRGSAQTTNQNALRPTYLSLLVITFLWSTSYAIMTLTIERWCVLRRHDDNDDDPIQRLFESKKPKGNRQNGKKKKKSNNIGTNTLDFCERNYFIEVFIFCLGCDWRSRNSINAIGCD